MENFEEKLKRLEELSQDIKRGDISLEDALKDFEEGIKLAKGMEKELDAIESKVQILMNAPLSDSSGDDENSTQAAKKKSAAKKTEGPVLDLFNGSTEINGTRNA